MSDTLDIIINDGRWASENPILALKRKPSPGALHVVTVGEVIPARLWFYDGPEGAASLSSARKNGVTLGLFGKLVRKDGETLLFGTTVFTELQDARGDYGYACSLDLLTDELKNAFNQGFDGTAFVDIAVNGVRKHQFKLPIRPRTYAGTELDTHPAAEGLLAEMQAAAAEADADAAAANAAKTAAAGFRDEAQGFRNEAEGFKSEAEAARDESVAAKDISVTKAGEAAGSATSAAGSATTATTKAGEASDSADEAAASAASIVPAPANSIAKANERVGGDDPRLGVKGGHYAPYAPSAGIYFTGLDLGAKAIAPGSPWSLIQRVKLDGDNAAIAGISLDTAYGIPYGGIYVGPTGVIYAVVLHESGTGSHSFEFSDSVVPVGEWSDVGIISDGDVVTVQVGGVRSALSWNISGQPAPGLFAVCGGTSNTPRSGGVYWEPKYYNAALTEDKITACAKGEAPKELAMLARQIYSNDAGWTAWAATGSATVTPSAGTLHVASTASGGGMTGYAAGTFDRRRTYRAKLVVSSVSTAGYIHMQGTSGGGTSVGANITSPGTYYLTVAGCDSGSPWFYFFDPVDFVLDGMAIEAIGTIDRFPSNQVSPDATLCGIFGTLLHSSGGSTPLAPNPGITRTARVTMADVSVSAGAEANSALSAVAGDEVSARLVAGILPGYACRFTPDTDMPDGLIDKRGPKVTGAGAVNLRIRNATAGSLNTGAITGTLTIHIR